VLHDRQFNMTYGAAILVLGQTGGTEAFDSLQNLYLRYYTGPPGTLMNKTSRVTAKLILLAMAEGRMEDGSVLPFLVKETWSAEPELRETAAYALHGIAARKSGGKAHGLVRSTIPITPSMTGGKFQLMDLLEDWTGVPAYAFEPAHVSYLAPVFQDVVEKEIGAFRAKPQLGAPDFEDLSRLLDVLLTDQGDLQWAPVTAHLAAGSAAASRAVIEQACREKLAGVDEILEACHGSSLKTAQALVVPLIALVAHVVADPVPDILILIATSAPDSPEGLAAIRALGSYAQPEAVDTLRKAAESAGWVTRVAIVEALRSIGTAGACSLLETLQAKDGSSAVKAMAQEALASCPAGM
jgi:hypothetical protein